MTKLPYTNTSRETPVQYEMRTRSLALWNKQQAALNALKPQYTIDCWSQYAAAMDACNKAYYHLHRVLEDEIRQKHGLPALVWRKQ